MANPLSFKDFLAVDYTPGMPDQISYNSIKRKRGRIGEDSTDEDCWSGYKRVGMKKKGDKMVPNCVPEDQQTTQEKLSLASRRALARAMVKNKAKIKMGRRRAMQKTATQEVLMKRARKAARNTLFQKFAKKDRSEMTPSRRASIEDRIDKMKGKVDKLARKLIPQIRKRERDRKSAK